MLTRRRLVKALQIWTRSLFKKTFQLIPLLTVWYESPMPLLFRQIWRMKDQPRMFQ